MNLEELKEQVEYFVRMKEEIEANPSNSFSIYHRRPEGESMKLKELKEQVERFVRMKEEIEAKDQREDL